MRLTKTDGFTIGLITIAGFAIILNGILREPPTVITDTYQYPDDTKTVMEDKSSEIMALNKETGPPIKAAPASIEESPLPSFSAAFAQARRMRGPGAIFEWNGKSYTTNIPQDLVKPEKIVDSTQFDFVLNLPKK